MSRTKSLVAEDYDATQGHIDPFTYPGEDDNPMNSLTREEYVDMALTDFTLEELEAAIDKRYTQKFDEMPIMVGTHKMLDDFVNLYTPNSQPTDERMPF